METRKKWTLNECQALAQTRGGACLSSAYQYKLMKWICADGHIWETMPHNITKGSWCPICAKSRWYSESKCRYIFENSVGQKFPSTRKALGNGLELDGYNEGLKLAFEYQGKQHYEFIPHINRSFEKFVALKKRDQKKAKECEARGIGLVIVPYWESSSDKNLVEFIKRCLGKRCVNGVLLPLDEFYKLCSPLNRVRDMAQEKGGRCLSVEYTSDRKKLEFECKRGHRWFTTAKQIKKGRWCPICGGGYLKDMTDLQDIAHRKGGRCLSSQYLGAKGKVNVECGEGHQWSASATAIRSGGWCPYCAGQRKNADDLHEIALSKGGRCLSSEYKNANTPMKFRCANSHQWFARPTNIRSGTWCPKCKNRNVEL